MTTMVCPVCAARYGGAINPHCPACLGGGTLTVDGSHLGEPDPYTAARSVQMYFARMVDHPANDTALHTTTDALLASGLIRRPLTAVPSPPEEIRTATATFRPCELYAHTDSPIVVRTQGHHRRPLYLQRRLYNGATPNDDLLWVCGLCHDSIHELLSYRLGEARKPDPMPGRHVRQAVNETLAWYQAAQTLGLSDHT